MSRLRFGAFTEVVVQALCCPVCGEPLARHDAALACERRHTFEVARAGYVNLLPGVKLGRRGDTQQMVAARERFLATGAYRALDETLANDLRSTCGLIVEIGAGTGAHLQSVLASAPSSHGLALDISRPAATVAARRHPRLASVIADGESRFPLRSRAVQTFMSAFAPRNIPELWRCLAEGGVLLIARAGPRHLGELSGALLHVDPHKEERLSERTAGYFEEVDRRELLVPLALDPATAVDLVMMGPAAFHVDAASVAARLESSAPIRATAHFVISRYRRQIR